jgi:hypothetical protein
VTVLYEIPRNEFPEKDRVQIIRQFFPKSFQIMVHCFAPTSLYMKILAEKARTRKGEKRSQD